MLPRVDTNMASQAATCGASFLAPFSFRVEPDNPVSAGHVRESIVYRGTINGTFIEIADDLQAKTFAGWLARCTADASGVTPTASTQRVTACRWHRPCDRVLTAPTGFG